MRKLTNYLLGLFAIVALLTFVSCEDDKATPIDPPTAAFTAEASSDFSGTVTFTNTSIEADSYTWDFGDGAGNSAEESPVYVYNASGTYTVKLIAINAGGADTTTNEVAINVLGENLVQAGETNWTAYPGYQNPVTFSDAGAHFTYTSADGWQQAGIYQTVTIEAGKTYTVDLNAESTSGLSNSWFEVYVDYEAPVEAQDYNAGGKKRSINSWDGCAGAPFNGLISEIGCGQEEDGTPKNTGLFTATEAGTVHIVIRSGGENADHYADGVVVSNVTLREVK